MKIQLARLFVFAVAVIAANQFTQPVQAQGFDSEYGAFFGSAYQFRTALPTPPYFAIYSPVYYGQRYERPYGISPFPAPALLQPTAEYQGSIKTDAITIRKPQCASCGSTSVAVGTQPLAHQEGRSAWIENPFVTSPSAIASK